MGRPLLAWTFVLCTLGPSLAQERDLTTFDFRRLDLRQVGNRWQLMHGGAVFKDLGTSEADAREALGVIRDLQLNQRGTVGSREPVMEYWLADHQAPRGLVAPQKLVPIDRSSLRVEPLMGQWCVRDARGVLFNFGRFEGDARKALAILQRYGFNRVGYIGRPAPVMIYFMEGKDDNAGRPPAPAMIDARQLWQLRQLGQAPLVPFDPVSGEEREPVDWRRVELKRDGSRWKVVLGNECLADFGAHETEAREAQRVFQHYRFTERRRIGQSATPFSYYLVNGQAAHGLKFGLRTVSFRSERLTVQRIDEQWMLCEDQRPILRGGDSKEEATQVLKAIQKYKFDNLCRIGATEQAGLSFLVRER